MNSNKMNYIWFTFLLTFLRLLNGLFFLSSRSLSSLSPCLLLAARAVWLPLQRIRALVESCQVSKSVSQPPPPVQHLHPSVALFLAVYSLGLHPGDRMPWPSWIMAWSRLFSWCLRGPWRWGLWWILLRSVYQSLRVLQSSHLWLSLVDAVEINWFGLISCLGDHENENHLTLHPC